MSGAACPAEPVIAAFAAERLAGPEADALKRHLLGCASCRSRVSQVKAALSPDASEATDVVGPRTDSEFPRVQARDAESTSPLDRGDAIGRFLVVGTLGEGGMGVVYLAYDPELDRRVAIKLMRPDAVQDDPGGGSGASRLLREAQAMARLQHPHVVAVYDVGTFADKIFVAMELVEGTTVKRWMRSERRPWREVQRIFLDAGRGLAAAHAAGMVHRDFKPDNVLLGRDGRAKVTDFGLARAVDEKDPPPSSDSPAKTSAEISDGGMFNVDLTKTGVVMGTPAYMAPEQVIAAPVDARTDQFSFCVSMYEALYGERPYESRVDPRFPLPVRDAPKGSDVPGWLRRVLLRGISIRPDERFPSIEALLLALGDDPALRRRRVLIATAVLGMLGLAVGGIAYQVSRLPPDVCASPERELRGVWDEATQRGVHAAFVGTGAPGAEQTWTYAQRAMDRSTAAWIASYRDACHDARVEHRESESSLQLRLDCLDQQRTDIRAVVAMFAHADKGVLDAASGAAASLPRASECGDSRALAVVDPPPPDAAAQVEALRLKLASAKALSGAGVYREAIAQLTPLAKQAHDIGYRPLEADVLFNLGHAQGRNTDFAAAAASFALALDVGLVARTDQLAARAAARRVGALALAGSAVPEIEMAVRQARPLVARAGEASIPALEFEQALGLVDSNRGREKEAAEHFGRAADLAVKVYGLDHPQTLIALNNLGAGLNGLGRYDDEIAAYRRALDVSDRLFGPESDNARIVWTNIAQAQADLGRTTETVTAMEHVMALSHQHGDNLYTSTALGAAARTLALQGEVARAELLSDQAMAIAVKRGATDVPDMGDVLRYAAEVHLAAGKPADAVRDYERAVHLQTRELDAKSPDWVQYLRVGGAAYLANGQPEKARDALERALALGESRPFYPGWLAEMRFNLARALVATHGDAARAQALAMRAHEELQKEPTQKQLLRQVDGWLASR